MPILHGLPPIENPDARALVLGSIPGGTSLLRGRYYAHAQNLFWPFMENALGIPATLPYADRIEHLRMCGVALWDVIARCERDGSLDSAIRAAVANDFGAFFDGHRALRAILFNGAAAETTFRRQVAADVLPAGVQLVRLPSTSPANRALGAAEKSVAWERALRDAGVRRLGEAPV